MDKKSLKADALANLYRAAYFLAKGQNKVGLSFFNKAKNKLKIPLSPISLSSRQDSLFFAEKVLDQYLLLKSKI